MKFVMRARGYCYPEGCEQITICYVCKDGSISQARSQARIYDSEAEAWEHARAADLIGGTTLAPWCWVEVVDWCPNCENNSGWTRHLGAHNEEIVEECEDHYLD